MFVHFLIDRLIKTVPIVLSTGAYTSTTDTLFSQIVRYGTSLSIKHVSDTVVVV